jgi:hypothetical protein
METQNKNEQKSQIQLLYEKYRGKTSRTDGFTGVIVGYQPKMELLVMRITKSDKDTIGWESHRAVTILDSEEAKLGYWYVIESDLVSRKKSTLMIGVKKLRDDLMKHEAWSSEYVVSQLDKLIKRFDKEK